MLFRFTTFIIDSKDYIMRKFIIAEKNENDDHKIHAVGYNRWVNFRGGAKFASLVHNEKFKYGYECFQGAICHKSEKIAGEMADRFDKMEGKPDYFVFDVDGNLYDKVVLENGELSIEKNGDLLSNHCDYVVKG